NSQAARRIAPVESPGKGGGREDLIFPERLSDTSIRGDGNERQQKKTEPFHCGPPTRDPRGAENSRHPEQTSFGEGGRQTAAGQRRFRAACPDGRDRRSPGRLRKCGSEKSRRSKRDSDGDRPSQTRSPAAASVESQPGKHREPQYASHHQLFRIAQRDRRLSREPRPRSKSRNHSHSEADQHEQPSPTRSPNPVSRRKHESEEGKRAQIHRREETHDLTVIE